MLKKLVSVALATVMAVGMGAVVYATDNATTSFDVVSFPKTESVSKEIKTSFIEANSGNSNVNFINGIDSTVDCVAVANQTPTLAEKYPMIYDFLVKDAIENSARGKTAYVVVIDQTNEKFTMKADVVRDQQDESQHMDIEQDMDSRYVPCPGPSGHRMETGTAYFHELIGDNRCEKSSSRFAICVYCEYGYIIGEIQKVSTHNVGTGDCPFESA